MFLPSLGTQYACKSLQRHLAIRSLASCGTGGFGIQPATPFADGWQGGLEGVLKRPR